MQSGAPGGGGGKTQLGAPGAAHFSAGARARHCCVGLRAGRPQVGLVSNDEASRDRTLYFVSLVG